MVYGERPSFQSKGRSRSIRLDDSDEFTQLPASIALPHCSHQPDSNQPPVADYMQGGGGCTHITQRLSHSLLSPFSLSDINSTSSFTTTGADVDLPQQQRSIVVVVYKTMDRNGMPLLYSPRRRHFVDESISEPVFIAAVL